MKPLRIGSLFAGIGGLELGLEWAGLGYTAWQVEMGDYCNKVLAKHWPDVRRYRDVREVGKHNLEPVDIICGGFPCQAFSTAAHGHHTAEDMRPEYVRIVAETKPRYVLAENVTKKAIDGAADGFRCLGYQTAQFRLSASDVGADHQRRRWWVFAHPDNEGEFQGFIDAKMAELPQMAQSVWGWSNYARAVRIHDGIPGRMDRLKCLGNAVVPQVSMVIGLIIKQWMEEME